MLTVALIERELAEAIDGDSEGNPANPLLERNYELHYALSSATATLRSCAMELHLNLPEAIAQLLHAIGQRSCAAGKTASV